MNRSRILLCDAESQSLHALRVVLHEAGFEVDVTCRRLREWSAMPVILLSAVCDEEQQVRAFEAGADDYVTKPFRPRELVARLHAKLRRADPGSEEPCVHLDGLEIDLAARSVRRAGEVVHLTPIEFKLLRVLTQNRGRPLTHNMLLAQVWGTVHMDGRATLRAHIANLRHKIELADGERLIHTNHGIGYRLADAHPHRPGLPRPALDAPHRRAAKDARVSATNRSASSRRAHDYEVSGCGLRVA
jgi:two-component system KDP operon response regulator KdpE